MKIILDDKRPFPDGPYNCVRTYDDCIELIYLFRKISYISLDYDLGSDKTGYDVLVYMAEHNVPVSHINIHSDHSIGAPRMRQYVQENFSNTVLTFNRL